MQAKKDYFYSAFFTFIFLWFTRLYLFFPLFFFFKLTCVEFQVRIMLHFAYSIFYIKPQTISYCFPLFLFFKLTCVEFQVRIMLHFAYSIFYIKPQTISYCFEFVWSFVVVFCNWWNGGKQINFQLYSIFDILVHINCILTR
jgi:hypothetical protein